MVLEPWKEQWWFSYFMELRFNGGFFQEDKNWLDIQTTL